MLYTVFGSMGDLSDRPIAKTPEMVPKFIAICLYALEAVGVVCERGQRPRDML